MEQELPLGPFTESESLLTSNGELGDFSLESREAAEVNDSIGVGHFTVWGVTSRHVYI